MVPAFLHPSAADISGFLNAFHLAAPSHESQSFKTTSPPHLPQKHLSGQGSPPSLNKEVPSMMIPVSSHPGIPSHLLPPTSSSSSSPSAYHDWRAAAFLSSYMQTLWHQGSGAFFTGANGGPRDTAHQQYLYDCEQYLKEQHFIAALESHCSPLGSSADASSPKTLLDQHGCLH